MGNRFGRQQKRRLRERVERLEWQLTVAKAARNMAFEREQRTLQECNRITKMVNCLVEVPAREKFSKIVEDAVVAGARRCDVAREIADLAIELAQKMYSIEGSVEYNERTHPYSPLPILMGRVRIKPQELVFCTPVSQFEAMPRSAVGG